MKIQSNPGASNGHATNLVRASNESVTGVQRPEDEQLLLLLLTWNAHGQHGCAWGSMAVHGSERAIWTKRFRYKQGRMIDVYIWDAPFYTKTQNKVEHIDAPFLWNEKLRIRGDISAQGAYFDRSVLLSSRFWLTLHLTQVPKMKNSKSRLPRNQHFPVSGVRSSGLLKSPELGTPDFDFSKLRFSNVPKWLKSFLFWSKQSIEILASSTPTEKWFFKSHSSVGVLEARISADCLLQNKKLLSHFGTFEKRSFEKSKSGVPSSGLSKSGVLSSGLFRSPELWTVKTKKKLIFKPIYFWNCRNAKMLWKVIKIDGFLRIMWGGIQTAQLFCP